MLSDKDLHSIYNDGAQSDHISGLRMVWDRAVAWVAAEAAGIKDEVQSLIVKTEDVFKHVQLEAETAPEAPVVEPVVSKAREGDIVRFFGAIGDETMEGFVTKVWSDTCVNLKLFGPEVLHSDYETATPRYEPTSVLLIADDAKWGEPGTPAANFATRDMLFERPAA